MDLASFIAVKGQQAQGNKLSTKKIQQIELLESEISIQKKQENVQEVTTDTKNEKQTNDESPNPTDDKIVIDENSTDNQIKLEI